MLQTWNLGLNEVPQISVLYFLTYTKSGILVTNIFSDEMFLKYYSVESFDFILIFHCLENFVTFKTTESQKLAYFHVASPLS